MNPLLSRAEAEALLQPYLADVCAPIRSAWKRWDELPVATRQPFTERTRANIIHDWTVLEAKRTLDRPPALTLTEQPGFLVVTVEDRLALRYKKLDDDLAIAGIPTSQFQLWSGQQTLEGLEPLTNITVGYCVTEMGKLGEIMLLCKVKDRTLWRIDEPEEAGGAVVLPLPTPVEPPRPNITPAIEPAAEDPAEES
jgi:hypothetical protein